MLFEATQDLFKQSVMLLEAAIDLLEVCVVLLEPVKDLANLIPMFNVLVRQRRGQASDIPEKHNDPFHLTREVIEPSSQGFNPTVGRLALRPKSLGQSFKCQR